jgi:maltooligosyltrehalose trehalohydrolase
MSNAKCFRVWAPLRSKVELQLGAKRLAMSRSESESVEGTGDRPGWWTIEARVPEGAADYGFILDGEGPFPDPRSHLQPNGVHQLSRVVDHGAFKWTDGRWSAGSLSSSIFYELHIGTFTPEGTFDAAIGKLDHLVRLGVTHVEVMPVNEFPGNRGWGYDGVDLFAPHHAYGGPDGLKRFVQACHARKLAVILDVVYNHLGPAGNYLARFGPYFTTRYSTPWGTALNFDDRDSHEVRRFFCDNALMWLRDYHFDGLRLDAVHAILDASAQPFLEQLKLEVETLETELGRKLVLIAESDSNDPRLLWPRDRGGFNLDAQWSDDFHHALHSVLTSETAGYYSDFGSLGDIAKALRHAFVYDGQFSKFRERRHGRSTEGLGGDRFVVCLQNHDQVGNRALGERIHQILASEGEGGNPRSSGLLKIGTALMLTGPFTPLLFQGQEWAASTPFLYFTDHDKKLGQAIRDGRCREFTEFGWKPEEVPDPQALATFQSSKLDWSELARASRTEILEWHRQLIRLRRTEPELADGPLDAVAVKCDERGRWLAVERGSFTIACNFADRTQAVKLRPGANAFVLASGAGVKVSSGSVKLPAASVAILKHG